MQTLFKKIIPAVFFLAIMCFLTSCAQKISQENFEKIQPGMTMQQVVQILGEPTNVESFNIAGLSGTSATWEHHNAIISIQFLNNQVKIKTFGKSKSKMNSDDKLSPNADSNANINSSSPITIPVPLNTNPAK